MRKCITSDKKCHFEKMNQADCCCCSVNKTQFFLLVEIKRKPSLEDRHFVTLHILPKGQERFEKIEHDMYYKFKEVFEKIPEHKREQVIKYLRLYREACLAVEESNDD